MRTDRSLRRFLAYRGFYPLAWLSAIACGVLGAQMIHTRSVEDHFLAWNLFLAWVPYLCSLMAAGIDRVRPGRWRLLAWPTLVWLIFLPNAPYLVTDFIHLHQLATHSKWFNVLLLSLFALNGCALGVVSLRVMHEIFQKRLGARVSGVAVLMVATLCGAGVYMGRFLRWNSWHVLTEPGHIFDSIAAALVNPLSHRRALAVTLGFTLLVLGLYLVLDTLLRRRGTEAFGEEN